MGDHHEPFMALGPIHWDDVPVNSLSLFLNDIFADARTIIDSIPSSMTMTAVIGRARSKTDPAITDDASKKTTSLSPNHSAAPLSVAGKLRKEWKEIKMNSKDNPLGISVYKLASKDGRGGWFCRRSLHEAPSFETWRKGFEKEFPETMKIQTGPGSGNIRGIGADRVVEDKLVDGVGHLSVFQLSAQFPGPTSPRDFVTLFLTSDLTPQHAGPSRPLRQYMIVSKPCMHPDCPHRPGIIRGQYESVELVREVLIEHDTPLPSNEKRSLSPANPGVAERRRSGIEPREDRPIAVEWLMVTRSDPGGSVPRFMVEKGTPPGIIGDAGKFVNWLTSKSKGDFATEDVGPSTEPAMDSGANTQSISPALHHLHPHDDDNDDHLQQHEAVAEHAPNSNGIYGIISGIYGVASSVVASGLRQLGTPEGSSVSQESSHENEEHEGEYEDEDDEDDNHTVSSRSSSIGTFASALERSLGEEHAHSLAGVTSDGSKGQKNRSLEKELKKLQERRRKLDEKAVHMQDALESKRRGSKEKDDALVAKMRDKYERELAKQEAKYRRELQKLEEKRGQEERKAEERRRKAAEKEEKLALAMELDKARVDRDVALKQVEILKGQVGELQAQNTMLVAKMGKMLGVEKADMSSDSKGSGGTSTKSA